jgi:hypothetical protein
MSRALAFLNPRTTTENVGDIFIEDSVKRILVYDAGPQYRCRPAPGLDGLRSGQNQPVRRRRHRRLEPLVRDLRRDGRWTPRLEDLRRIRVP